MYSIADLNQMERERFGQILGGIFEGTPAIADAVWLRRPFRDREDLHRAMVAVVAAMSLAEQLALIRAHPDLGSRAKMADASVQEQASAGLDQLTATEYARFERLNRAYRDRFGFPFIIAVRNHTKSSILQAFETRLGHSAPAEHQQALTEIYQIAYHRLVAIVAADGSP